MRKVFSGAYGGGIKRVTLETVDCDKGVGNFYGWERGVYKFFNEKGENVDVGKYLVTWKRVGGKWLLHMDCFNSTKG